MIARAIVLLPDPVPPAMAMTNGRCSVVFLTGVLEGTCARQGPGRYPPAPERRRRTAYSVMATQSLLAIESCATSPDRVRPIQYASLKSSMLDTACTS